MNDSTVSLVKMAAVEALARNTALTVLKGWGLF